MTDRLVENLTHARDELLALTQHIPANFGLLEPHQQRVILEELAGLREQAHDLIAKIEEHLPAPEEDMLS